MGLFSLLEHENMLDDDGRVAVGRNFGREHHHKHEDSVSTATEAEADELLVRRDPDGHTLREGVEVDFHDLLDLNGQAIPGQKFAAHIFDRVGQGKAEVLQRLSPNADEVLAVLLRCKERSEVFRRVKQVVDAKLREVAERLQNGDARSRKMAALGLVMSPGDDVPSAAGRAGAEVEVDAQLFEIVHGLNWLCEYLHAVGSVLNEDLEQALRALPPQLREYVERARRRADLFAFLDEYELRSPEAALQLAGIVAGNVKEAGLNAGENLGVAGRTGEDAGKCKQRTLLTHLSLSEIARAAEETKPFRAFPMMVTRDEQAGRGKVAKSRSGTNAFLYYNELEQQKQKRDDRSMIPEAKQPAFKPLFSDPAVIAKIEGDADIGASKLRLLFDADRYFDLVDPLDASRSFLPATAIQRENAALAEARAELESELAHLQPEGPFGSALQDDDGGESGRSKKKSPSPKRPLLSDWKSMDGSTLLAYVAGDGKTPAQEDLDFAFAEEDAGLRARVQGRLKTHNYDGAALFQELNRDYEFREPPKKSDKKFVKFLDRNRNALLEQIDAEEGFSSDDPNPELLGRLQLRAVSLINGLSRLEGRRARKKRRKDESRSRRSVEEDAALSQLDLKLLFPQLSAKELNRFSSFAFADTTKRHARQKLSGILDDDKRTPLERFSGLYQRLALASNIRAGRYFFDTERDKILKLQPNAVAGAGGRSSEKRKLLFSELWHEALQRIGRVRMRRFLTAGGSVFGPDAVLEKLYHDKVAWDLLGSAQILSKIKHEHVLKVADVEIVCGGVGGGTPVESAGAAAAFNTGSGGGSSSSTSHPQPFLAGDEVLLKRSALDAMGYGGNMATIPGGKYRRHPCEGLVDQILASYPRDRPKLVVKDGVLSVTRDEAYVNRKNYHHDYNKAAVGEEDAARQLLPRMTLRVDVVDVLSDTVIGEYRVDVEDLVHSQTEKELRLTERILYDVGTLDEDEAVDGRGMHRVSAAQAVLTGDAGEQRVTSWETPFLDPPQFSSAPASAHEQRVSPGGHEQEHDADLNMPGFLTVIRHELRPLHGRELRVPRVLLRDVLLDANDPRFEDFRLLTKFVKAGYQLGVRGSCGNYAQAAANDEAALAEAFEMLKLGEDVGMAGIIKGNKRSGTTAASPMMYYGEEQEGASLQRGRGSELDHASTAELLSLWPVMRVRRFVVHRNCVVPEMDAELADVVHDSSLVRPSSFVPLAGPLGIVAGFTGEGRGEDDLPTAAASGVSVPALPLRVRPRNVVMAAAYESALRNCFPGGGGAENGTCSLLLHVAHGEIDAAETESPEDDESSDDPRSAPGKTTTGVADRERGAGDDEDLSDPAEEEAEEEPAEEEDLDDPEPLPPGGASSAAKPALYAQLSLDRFAAYEALARKTKKRKRSKRKAGSKRDSGRGRMSNLRSSAAGNVFLEEEDDEEENLALRFAPQAVVAVLSAETGRLLRAQPVLFPCHYLQLERKTSVAAAMRVVDKQPGAEADAAATADARDREADADEVGSHLISELALLRRSPLDEGPPHLLSAKQQTLYAMAQEGYLFRTLGVVRDTSAVTNGRADTGQERTLVSIAVYDYREARVGVAAQDRDHEGETGNDGQITYMVPQEWLAHFQPLFLHEEAILIATQNSAIGGPGVGGGGGFSFKRGSVVNDVENDEDFGDVQHRQKTIAQDLKAVARLRQILEVTGNSYSDVVCTAVFDAGWIGSGKRAIVSVAGYTGEALESLTSDAEEETDFEREDPPFAGSVVNEMELPLHWLQPLLRIDAAALVERQTAVQLRDVVPARRYRDRVQFIKHHVEQQGATLFAGPVEFGGPVGTEMETGRRVVTTTGANKTHILQARMDSAGKRSMAADAAAFFGAELEGEARELAGKVAFEEEADAHGENQLLKIPGPRLRVQVWQKGFLMREVTLPAAYLAPVIAPGTGSSPASATVGTTLLAQQVKHMQTRTSSSTRSTSARSALLSKIIHRLADEAEREYLHGSFLPGELLQVHSDPAMWPNQKNLLGVTLKELSMGKYDDVRFAQSLSEHAVVAVLVDRQNQAVKVVQLPRSALLPALSQFASFFTPGLEMGGVSPFLHQFTDFLGDESTHYDSSSVTRTRNVLVRAEVEVAAQLNFNSSGNAVAGVSKDNPDSNQLAQAGAGRSFRVLLPGDEILLRPGFAFGQALERHITDGATCTVAQVACGGHWCMVHTNVSPEVLRGSVEKNALPSAGVTVLSFAGGAPHVASSDEDTRSVASSAHLFSSEAGDSQSDTEAATGRGASARQTFFWVPARFLEIPSPHAELEECALGKHVTTRDVILAHAWLSATRRIRVAFHAILLSLGPTLAEIGTLSRDGCYEIIHIPKQYVKFDDSTLPAASTYDYKAVENIRAPDSKISSGVEEQEVTTALDENASAAQVVHETRNASLREDDPMRMNTVEQSFASLQKLLAAFPHDASVFLRADPDPSAQLLALLDEMKAFGGLDAPQPGVRPVDIVVDTVYEHRVGVRIVLSKENATSDASGSTMVHRSKEFVLNPSSLHIPHAHHEGGGDAFAGTSMKEVLSAGLPTSTATAAVNKKYRATARAKAQALNESRPTIFAKKQRVALREVAGLTGAASDPQYAKVRDFVANVPKARVIVHNEDVVTRDVSVMLLDVDAMPLERATLRAGLLERYLGDEPLLSGKTPAVFAGSGTGENSSLQTEAHKVEVSIRPVVNYKGYKSALERLRRLQARGDRLLVAERDARKKADRIVVLVHRAYSAKGETARLLPNPLVCTEVVPRDCLRLRVGRNSRRKKSRAEGGADHDLELEEDLESFILNEEVKLRNSFGKTVGTVFAPGSEVFLVGRAPAADPACAKFVDTYYKVDGAISASSVRLEVRGQSGANVCVEPVVARKTAGLHASLAAPSPERPFLFPANLLVPAISGEHQDTTMHKPPGTLLQPGGGHAQSQMRTNVYRPLQEVLLRDICVSAREFPSVATVRRHIEDSGAVLIIASVLPNDASAAQDGSSSAAAACEKLDIAVMLPAAWRDAQKEAAKRPTVAEADEYYSHLFHDAASSVLLFSAVPSLFFTPRHGFGSSDAQHIVPLQAGEVVRLRSMVWSHFADDGSGNGWTQEELGAITRANALTQERLVVAGYVPGSGAANVEKDGGTPQKLHEQVEVWVFDKLVAEPVLTLVLPVAALEPALVEDSEEAMAYRDSQAQHAIQYRDFMTEKILAGAGFGLTQTDKRDASKVADGEASELDAASSKKNRYAKRKGVRRKQGGSDPKNPLPPIDEEDVEDDAAPSATALVDGDTAPAAAAGTTSDVTQAPDAAPPPPRKTFSPLGRYYIASGDRVLISKLNSEGRSKSSTATSNNKRRIGDVADSNPVLQKVKQRSVLDGVEIKVLRYRNDVAEVSLSQPGPDRNSLLDYHRVGEKQEILNVPAYCLLPSIDPDMPDRQAGDVMYLREVFLPAPASGASMSAEEKKNRSVLKGDLLAAELFLRGNSNGLRKMRLMQEPRELDGESLRETVACELLFATDGDDAAGSQHGTAVARVVQLPLAALSPAMRPPHTGETAVLRPLVGPTDYEDAVGGVRSLLQSIPDARLFVVRVHHQFAEVCVFVNGMRVIPPGSVGEVGGRARKSQAAAANVKNDGKKEAGELDAAADDDLVDEFEPEPLGTGPGFVAVPLFLLAAVDHRVMAEICAPLKPKLPPLDFLPEVFLTLPAARVDLTAVAHKDPRQDIARTLSLLEKELARAPISIRVLRLVKRAPLRPDSFSTTDSDIEFSYDAEVVVSRNRSAGSSSASGNEILQSKRLLLPAERLEQARLPATEDLRIGEFVHVRRCCFNHSAFPDIDEARRAVRKGLVFRVLTKLPVAGDAATFFLRVVASSANIAASSSPKKRAAVSPAVKFSLPHFSVVRWSSPSLGVHVEGSDSKVAVRLRAIEVDDRWRPEANYLTEVRQGSLYGSVTTHLLTPGEEESMAREAGAKPHLAALDDKAAPDQMKTAAPAKMSRAKRHKNLVSWRADVGAGETVKVVVRQRLPAHLSSLVREAEAAGGEQGKAEDVATSEKWKQLQDGVRAERQRWAEKSLERVLEIPRAFLEREEDAAAVRPADRAEAARVQTRFRKNLQGEISQIESDLQNLRQITNQMKGAQAVAKKRVFEQKKAEAQQRGLTGRAYMPVSDMYSVGGHFSIVPSEGEEVSEVESRFSSMNEFARGSGFPSLRFTAADGGPATAGTAPVFSLFEHRDKVLSSTRGGASQRQHPSQKAPPRPFLGPQAGRDGALQTIRAGGDYSDASSEGAVQSGVSVMSRGPGSEASIHMNLDPQEGGATAGAADVPVFMADFRKEARKQHAAAKVPELKHQLHHGNRFSRFVEYNRMG
eukprot:g1102.t1